MQAKLRSLRHKKKALEFTQLSGIVTDVPQTNTRQAKLSFDIDTQDDGYKAILLDTDSVQISAGDSVSLICVNERYRAKGRYNEASSKEQRYSTLVNHTTGQSYAINSCHVINDTLRIQDVSYFPFVMAFLLAIYILNVNMPAVIHQLAGAMHSPFVAQLAFPSWVYAILAAIVTVLYGLMKSKAKSKNFEHELAGHIDRLKNEVVEEGPAKAPEPFFSTDINEEEHPEHAPQP